MSNGEENSQRENAEVPLKRRRGPIRVEVVTRRRWQEDALSYSAGVVAIAALLISIWQAQLSSKQNRISVRPVLGASTHFEDEVESIGLVVENRGVGPAVVQSAYLYLDGNLRGPMQDEQWVKLLEEAGVYERIRTTRYSLENGSVIPIGAQRRLLVLAAGSPQHEIPALEDLIEKRLGIEICYCSLYEDCWRLVTAQDMSSTDHAECGLKRLRRSEVHLTQSLHRTSTALCALAAR